jgi:hypothetical protein
MKTHFSLLAGLMVLTALPAQAQLNMFFTNDNSGYADSNIWISIQRGQAPTLDVTASNIPDVTYGLTAIQWHTYTNIVGTNTQIGSLYSDPVQLSTINAAGGLNWISNAPSAAIYISYGAALPVSSYSVSGISPSATVDASYNIPYQNFELTYYGNGNNSGNGDITAINFFTAPISLTSYTNASASNAIANNQTALQTKGFNPNVTGTTLLNAFQQISSGAGASPILTNTAGQYTRVIGPTQFGAGQPQAADFGSYTNFTQYFSNLVTTGNMTTFSNSSAYNSVANITGATSYTNAAVVFVLTNQVTTSTNGYGMQATGNITTTKITYSTNTGSPTTPVPIATNIVVSTNVIFSVTPNSTLTNLTAAFVYYGDYSAANGTTNISLGGAGWTNFTNTIQGFVNAGGTAAASIVNAQIAGEISTGYDAGLAGSTNLVVINGVTNVLGSLPSGAWWGLTNPPLFSDIQTNPYYNQYANVIYTNSSNTVYGMTYGDRFTDPSASPYIAAGTNVGSWLVGVGAPVGAVPEPSSGILVFAGLMVAAILIATRRKIKISEQLKNQD